MLMVCCNIWCLSQKWHKALSALCHFWERHQMLQQTISIHSVNLKDIEMRHLYCYFVSILYRHFSPNYSQKTLHSSPVRVSYEVYSKKRNINHHFILENFCLQSVTFVQLEVVKHSMRNIKYFHKLSNPLSIKCTHELATTIHPYQANQCTQRCTKWKHLYGVLIVSELS